MGRHYPRGGVWSPSVASSALAVRGRKFVGVVLCPDHAHQLGKVIPAMAETLSYLLDHALTNIKRCRKAAAKTQPRIAAHLDALIAQTEAIIADLEAGPAYATKVLVLPPSEVDSAKRRHRSIENPNPPSTRP